MTLEFHSFQKIPRYVKPVVVTEKIDGTNAVIAIEELLIPRPEEEPEDDATSVRILTSLEDGSRHRYRMKVGSRNKWLSKNDDNYGFWRWVFGDYVKFWEGENNHLDPKNPEPGHVFELLKLGVGYHYGEWWGNGIGRNYGKLEKTFSLFNVDRWNNNPKKPYCCSVVPIIDTYQGYDIKRLKDLMLKLRETGSVAQPGYMNPEGLIIQHTGSRQLYKLTYDQLEM